VMGTALFLLVRSSNSDTALERKDVKAFNVSEAGVDAGIAKLKAAWPRYSTDPAIHVVASDVRNLFPIDQFPNSAHQGAGAFVDAVAYDNSGTDPRNISANRVNYDANGDEKMWIDSVADVTDDRHRIVVLAQRQKMPLDIPDVALAAGSAGGNAQGLPVRVDPDYLGSLPDGGAGAYYTDVIGKGLELGPGITAYQGPDAFSSRVTESMRGLLEGLARAGQSYFDDSNGGAAATSTYLCDPVKGPGSIVYLDTDADPVVIEGNNQMGTPEKPIILVIDATDASGHLHAIDWRGTAAFYGVVIVFGNIELRGTMDIRGAVLSQGSVENKGGPGILYNGDLIRRLRDLHTLSVALVPGTWEEFNPVPGT